MRIFKYLFGCLLFMVMSLPVASAQTITGSVTGTVTDPSGATVKGATVTTTNTDTKVSFQGITNPDGVYSIKFLPIGPYTLTISATGFKKVSVRLFNLSADQEARFDQVLPLGANTEVVTVTDRAPLIDTQDAAMSTTFDSKQITELPLVADNILALGVLIPGSVDVNTLDNVPPTTGTGTTSNRSFNLNGNVGQATIILLDGQQISSVVNDSLDYNPNREAVSEVKIITNNATAEYGNANGGTLVMTTRSGTDRFHGEAWGQQQSTPFNANTYANKRTIGIDKAAGTYATLTPIARASLQTPPMNRTFFGGQVGGPLLRNKLFFFVDYKGIRFHADQTVSERVPDADYEGLGSTCGPLGNLSCDMTGGLSTNPNTVNPMGYDPTTNNVYPITNPAAIYLISHGFYPTCNLCNHEATGGLTGTLGYNYTGSQELAIHTDQMDAKVDYAIDEKNHVSVRFSRLPDWYNGYVKAPFAAFGEGSTNFPYTGGVVNWDRVISQNITNEARVGFGRFSNYTLPQDVDGVFGTKGNSLLGIPGVQDYPGIAEFEYAGTGPNLSTFGAAATGGAATQSKINTFEYSDDLTWLAGRHSLKMGAWFLHAQNNTFYSGPSGALGFFEYDPAGTTGAPDSYWADFLSDQALTYGQGANSGEWGQREWRDSAYFQDDFKVKPNLTLNLGMRWEYDRPRPEVHNRQANVDPNTGVVSVAGVDGVSPGIVHSFWGGFMPRVGFAYTPEVLNNRLVVRGGYAITNFFQGIGATLNLPLNPLFVYNSTPAANAAPPFKVENGFGTGVPGTISGKFPIFAPNLKPQLVQQYDLALEFQINNVSSIMLSYVGEDGHHLENVFAGDASPCTATAVGYPTSVTNVNGIPTGAGTGPTCNSPLLNANTPYNPPSTNSLGNEAAISPGGLEETASEGVLSYNALQAQYRRNFSHGWQLIANYTYDKSLVNGSTSFYPQNPTCISAGCGEYARAPWDARHIASGAAMYQLPIGRGQWIGHNWNPWLDGFLGGWKAALTSTWHTGFPLTISSNHYYNLTGQTQDTTSRANFYRPIHVVHRSSQQWFGNDPSATPCTNTTSLTTNPGAVFFKDVGGIPGNGNTTPYTSSNAPTIYLHNDNGKCAYGEQLTTGFGTAANGTEQAPGNQDVSASASKVFALPRGENVEFRVDAFNVFNFTALGSPSVSVSTPSTFGQITSAANTERHLQFALKYRF